MIKSKLLLAVIFLIGFNSCVKDKKIVPLTLAPAEVAFTFQAKVKSENLIPNTKMYTNAAEDSFTVTKFNYYISNLKLTRADGYVYSEPESYHLMQHVDGNTAFTLKGVPEGNYSKLEFLIGVDSLRNVSGARDGDLDPAKGMFWDWKQGYIFFKLEGSYNTSNVTQTGEYAIHVGGFKGPYACLQTCEFDLVTPVVAKMGKRSSVIYNVQIDQIFVKPMIIGFDYYYENVFNEKVFKDISNNYKDMFVIDKVEN